MLSFYKLVVDRKIRKGGRRGTPNSTFLDALAFLRSMLESQSLSHSIIHVFEIFGIYLGHVFGNFGNIFGISGA